MRKIRMTNEQGRDAVVRSITVRTEAVPTLGLPDGPVSFLRFLSTTEAGTHERLTAAHGVDYSSALIEGDPEVDFEHVGRAIGPTDVVWLDSAGKILHAPPRLVEVLVDPSGAERERRQPQDTPANVVDAPPLRWTRVRLSRQEAVRRFAFRRTLQLHHVDGLSYEYLHGMARQLDEAGQMVLVGAGARGRDPLIFQQNGTPYRAFLEGRVEGSRYRLLLHLSNLELKRPESEAS